MNFFQSQDNARKNTRWLIVLFLLAILSLVVLTNLLVILVFNHLNVNVASPEILISRFDWDVIMIVSGVVTGIILLGSLYKIIALAGGGARVAEMMNGQLIVEDSGDYNKQKILNVVEEMAIASGMPVPPVYLLDEDGINAFAAGYKASDAVIGITRGAIEKLSRDQLQGVIAHEFSHIFNGDMRLNIRLIGILYGITVIGTIGYYLLRSSSRSSRRSSRSNNGGGIVFLGLGLMAIGYTGTFFGNLIKAAVSRQREFLADASAVQFTRNPDGIAGALKRIGGDSAGSLLQNSHTTEISHALFCQGFSTYLEGLFSTHPPLPIRIRKIDPYWNGEFETPPVEQAKAEAEAETAADSEQKKAAVVAGVAVTMGMEAAVNSVGQPGAEHLQYSRQLLTEIPELLRNAAHEPCGARALIYFMVLDKDEAIRKKQLHQLMAHADPGAYRETVKLNNMTDGIADQQRLPLIDMALASLRQLSKQQYALFKANLNALIEMDDKISLSEWIIKKLVVHHLDRVFEKPQHPREKLSVKKNQHECAILLSLLCYSSQQQGIEPRQAFELARQKLGDFNIQLLDKNTLNLNALNQALDRLAQLKPLEKPALLKACAASITADKNITTTESELLRAIADTLDCPMPPLVV